MHDPVKYALWVGGFSMLVMVCAAFYIVFANVGSRNLALGLGALAGTCLIFVIQVVFELKGSESVIDFPVEYSIDYKARTVQSVSALQPNSGSRFRNIFVEMEANKLLTDSTFGIDDAPKIARDLAIVSFLAYLAEEQPDWQLQVVSYRTTFGTSIQWRPLSKDAERTRVDAATIRQSLKTAGNLFADIGRLGMRDMFDLPPGSTVQISSNSVRLVSPTVQVEFEIQEPFHSMHSMDPREVISSVQRQVPIQANMPLLDDGKTPQYQNVTLGIRTSVSFSALHAQSGDLPKYQAWTKRLIDGVQARFVSAQTRYP
jgi:hypothetical protein